MRGERSRGSRSVSRRPEALKVFSKRQGYVGTDSALASQVDEHRAAKGTVSMGNRGRKSGDANSNP